MTPFRPLLRHALLLAALLTACLVSAVSAAEWAASVAALASDRVLEEHWYTVNLQGAKAGWMHVKQTQEKDGRIVSESECRIAIARGATPVKMQLVGRFVETAEGEPISMWSMQKWGAMPQEMEYEFGPEFVAVKSKQGNHRTTSELPRPEGEWMTPAEAGRFLLARLEAGAESMTVRQIDPLSGINPVTMTRQLVERDVPLKVMGKKVLATKWKVEQDIMPGIEAFEYLDAEGLLVRGVTPMMGTEMTMELADKKTAMRQNDATPELMLATFVKPNRPIDRPRDATRVVIDLSVEGEASMPAIPSAGGQRAEVQEGGRVRLTVSTEESQAATSEEIADPAFLESSQMVGAADPSVAELAEKALARQEGTDAAAKAEAIRAFVHRYIREKSLDVGFASATEVARNREGDCSEHGVLTAAMLRAADIPSRVVVGLIYVDEFVGAEAIFGYHMWSQALVDGKWVDYDATLDRRYDATHVALWTSSLEDGSFQQDMGSLMQLMGRLKIDVIEVEH